MDTVALTAYLEAEWPELIAEASIDPARIVAIVEEHYLADTDLVDSWAEPLADYYLLRRAVRAFTPNMNVGTGGDSYALRQQYENAAKEFAAAEAKVTTLINKDAWSLGEPFTIDLNFLTGGA